MNINDFPTSDFALIKKIFFERHWKKITHVGPSRLVEVVREFYLNLSLLNLEDHSYVVRLVPIELFHSVL